MEFKIGDKVEWQLMEGQYEIIADKNHPYQGLDASPTRTPISVQNNCDFILRRLDKEGFTPFRHVREEHLKKIR